MIMVMMRYKGMLRDYFRFATKVRKGRGMGYEGRLYAFAGINPSDGSLQVVSIWKSRMVFEECFGKVIAPAFLDLGIEPPYPEILPLMFSLVGSEPPHWEIGPFTER